MKHQRINGLIHDCLLEQLNKCSPCEAFIPIDWKVDEETVLQPDNLVVCHPFEYGNYLTKMPALIFEILSPATALKDRTIKYNIYELQAVKYYVIIDPTTEKAEIFELIEGKYEKTAKLHKETFDFFIENCTLTFDFSKIWL